MRWLWAILALPVLAFSNPTTVRTARRTYFEDGHRYIVEYLYSKDNIDRPKIEATSLAPEKTHYEAEISVYEIKGGAKNLISRPFDGEYIELGCVEDEPALLVHRALASARRERAMNAKAVENR